MNNCLIARPCELLVLLSYIIPNYMHAAVDPPVIVKALENCAACEQGPAEFQAQITGSPFSHLSW